jgi:heme-degrading monooxygenase HmoA
MLKVRKDGVAAWVRIVSLSNPAVPMYRPQWQKEIIMYAVIRRYKFDAKDREEINHQVREAFLPLIREIPGFIGFYWLDTGAGEGASFSIFEDKAGTENSIRLAADFVREHLASVPGKPEILEGKIEAHTLAEVPAAV